MVSPARNLSADGISSNHSSNAANQAHLSAYGESIQAFILPSSWKTNPLSSLLDTYTPRYRFTKPLMQNLKTYYLG